MSDVDAFVRGMRISLELFRDELVVLLDELRNAGRRPDAADGVASVLDRLDASLDRIPPRFEVGE